MNSLGREAVILPMLYQTEALTLTNVGFSHPQSLVCFLTLSISRSGQVNHVWSQMSGAGLELQLTHELLTGPQHLEGQTYEENNSIGY